MLTIDTLAKMLTDGQLTCRRTATMDVCNMCMLNYCLEWDKSVLTNLFHE